MASEQLSLPEALSPCPGCQGEDALLLPCGHRLCQACLQLCQRELGQLGCTVCYSRDLLDVVLKRLLDSLFQGQPLRGAGEAGELCLQHGERLTLFCAEDEEPLCALCESEEHREHSCSPTDEATQDRKRELRSSLRRLQEQLDALRTVKQTYEDSMEHIKAQIELTERLVKEEFEELHQFLRDEEAAVIAEMKEEEDEKRQKLQASIDSITEEIDSLTDTVRQTEETMSADDISFLKAFRKTAERVQCTRQVAEELSGTLVDVAKHLGCLKYRVWEKMQNIVQYTPVTLDPNTADMCLSLSDDLTSVRYTDEEQQLPDNPERFSSSDCVLGSEGFSSGCHSWDVEVGESMEWSLGVADETMRRKEWFPPNPERGLWSIGFCRGEYRARTATNELIPVKKKPQRIRVQLDVDRGRLTFSDPSDNTLLYKFKHKFTERMFPYFSSTSRRHPLRILSGKVSVTAEEHALV